MNKRWVCKECDPMSPCIVEVGVLDDRPIYCPYVKGMVAEFIEETKQDEDIQD